jgi:hypothetical protein
MSSQTVDRLKACLGWTIILLPALCFVAALVMIFVGHTHQYGMVVYIVFALTAYGLIVRYGIFLR